MRFALAALLFGISLFGQTTGTVNIISGTVDLTQAVHTGPMISVATVDLLPTTNCIAGETALVTSAASGQQIYENKTAGTCAWTQQGSNPIIPPSPGYQPNQLLSGCGVEYTTGLSFTVGVCTYTIAGVTYTTAALANITLTTADPSNPRIDAIIVDNTSTVSFVTGTPAANPATPNIKPDTQLALANILVPAGATTPGGISSTLIYDENVEWTCTASANLNCASTNNPYHGSLDIEATAAVLGNNVTLVDPASGTVDLANFNYLIVYIRSKAAWPTKASGANAARFLTFFWKNGATQKGLGVVVRDGQFGFSSSITTVYQQLYIPASAFGINGTPVTTLEVLVSGNTGTSSIGFYLDEITLQSNTTVQPAPASSVPFSSILSGNNNNAAMVGSGTMTLDLSATTTTNAFKTQVKAGATATANGALAYDSTNNNLHAANTGADAVVPVTTVTPANGNCAQWVVAGGKIKLGDTGGACGGTPGGGIIGYSASALTITAATYYFPIVGGGLPSTTETNVDTEAPSAATIANFYASFSVALGGGNSAVFTYRNNATSQSLTCTISGASATTCHDITHSFSVAAGDLLTIQVITSGTIVVTPTLVMTAQFGTVGANGTVNTGTSGQIGYYAAGGTAISGVGPGTAKQLVQSNGTSGPQFIDFPDAKIIPGANCVAGTAGGGWSYATSTFTATCRAGTNNLGGALQAIPSTGAAGQFLFELPADWDTASQPYVKIFYSSGANTSGTVIWTIATGCSKGDGSVTDDPSFNAESAFGTQTMTAANRMWSQNGQLTAVTSGNNCIAGSSMIVKATLSGTAASNINVWQAVVTVPRLLTVQAE